MENKTMVKKEKKHYNKNDLDKLNLSGIRELKLNRIISKSNFYNEYFFEKNLLINIPPYILKEIYKVVDKKLNSNESPNYYVVVAEDYKLYEFEP
jgi:hypothetical protein